VKRVAATIAALVAACAQPAAAAFTSVGTFGSGSDVATFGFAAILASADVEVGNLAVCALSQDESGTGTTDGDNAKFVSISDGRGNTWTEIGETCNMQTSTTADGACVALYYSKVTTSIRASTDVLFATFSVGTASAGMTCWEFTAGGVAVAVGTNTSLVDAGDPASMTVATGIPVSHLFVRAAALETNGTWTPDADYSEMTESLYNGGSAPLSLLVVADYRIATEATSAADDPSASAASDNASIMAAFFETGRRWKAQILLE
jgi:hypothetical protein